MKKKKTRFFASPFIMIGLIILLLLMFSIWLVVLFPFLEGGNEVTSSEEMTMVFVGVSFFVVISILTFCGTCHKGFSIYEISERGVKRSLFKVFKKTEILWEEMSEIRFLGMISTWIFFSKTCLEGMPYNDIIKRKDVLQIECSKRIIEAIKLYTDKEIINLPDRLKKT